jgi:hypothetical protein
MDIFSATEAIGVWTQQLLEILVVLPNGPRAILVGGRNEQRSHSHTGNPSADCAKEILRNFAVEMLSFEDTQPMIGSI